MKFLKCLSGQERSAIKRIVLPENIYSVNNPHSKIPNMRSFMLTAAVQVFHSFMKKQIQFAFYVFHDKSFMTNLLSTHSFGNALTKSVMHRDLFLVCFSTMISQILSVNNVEAHVIICPRCVRKFVRKVVVEKNKPLELNLIDFVCDEKCMYYFENFANYLYSEKLFDNCNEATVCCFNDLLTYDFRNEIPDWRLLIWSWTHQVFAFLTTFNTDRENIDYVYYFVKTLVFNVFTQIECDKCATHSYYSHLETAFEYDFILYIMNEVSVDPTYWNAYGYMLHAIINLRILYAQDASGRCNVISFADFKENVLPYLITDKMLRIFGVKTLYAKMCNTKPDNVSYLIPFKDTFFDDDYNDLASEDITNNFLTRLRKNASQLPIG